MTSSGVAIGALGTTRIPVVTGLSIELGSLRLEDVVVGLVPLEHLEEVVGRPIDGIIGGDVLKSHVIVIDYDRQIIAAHTRNSFAFDEWGKACPLVGARELARVRGQIELLEGVSIDGQFAVDSGASKFLELAAPFVREHDLRTRVGATYSVPTRALTGVSLDNRIGHIRRFRFCGFEVPAANGARIPVGLSSAAEGVLAQGAVSGLLGNGILKRFNIVFDLSGRRMFLRQNRHWQTPIEVDASGLSFVRPPGGRVKVVHVVRGSPAFDVGIEKGDVLHSIDGNAVGEMALEAVRARLRQVGKVRQLELERGGSTLSVSVELRVLGSE